MSAQDLARKTGYVGGWIGVVLSLLFAVLPGIFVGGWIGLKVSSLIFGSPLDATMPVKIIMVAFMLWGLLTAIVIFIAGSSLIGYLVGFILKGKGGVQESG
jgi:hypothetical protein